MNIKKYIVFFWVLIIFFFNTAVVEGQNIPNITAPNAILMDYHTGTILYEHNAHQVTYPASTTKILTAILVLENTDLEDIVTIDYDLYVGGASMYLRKGESFTIEQLLKALLIRSANDAAEALAIHISGSVEAFTQLMNQRAKELGALNTHFTNPHGLPDDQHVTTAYDLAVITRHAMTFDLFREIVSTTMLIVEPTEFTPEQRIFRNSNRFLWGTGSSNQMLYNGKYINIKYDIIDGVKTGYTQKAQQCLVTSAKKDHHRLLAVVLGAQGTNIYSNSRALIDYGYNYFKLIELVAEDHLELKAPVINGTEEEVPLYTNSKLFAILPIDEDPSKIQKQIIQNKKITAPITAGTKLGKIVYSLEHEILGEVDLIAKEGIDVKPLLFKLNLSRKTIISVLLLFFILWQLLVAYLRFQKRKRRTLFLGKKNYSCQFNKDLINSSFSHSMRKR